MIIFTKHAKDKFRILKTHKFPIPKSRVLKTVKKPEFLDFSRLPLIIAQSKIDKSHVLRVVYKKEGWNMVIVTFYPGRIKQYEE